MLVQENEKYTNNLKGISNTQTKSIKFEEYYNCLFDGDYQKECDKYIICSIYYTMFNRK